jgi:hypothetical protein
MCYLSLEVPIVVPGRKIICNCNACKCDPGNFVAGGLYFKVSRVYGDMSLFSPVLVLVPSHDLVKILYL